MNLPSCAAAASAVRQLPVHLPAHQLARPHQRGLHGFTRAARVLLDVGVNHGAPVFVARGGPRARRGQRQKSQSPLLFRARLRAQTRRSPLLGRVPRVEQARGVTFAHLRRHARLARQTVVVQPAFDSVRRVLQQQLLGLRSAETSRLGEAPRRAGRLEARATGGPPPARAPARPRRAAGLLPPPAARWTRRTSWGWTRRGDVWISDEALPRQTETSKIGLQLINNPNSDVRSSTLCFYERGAGAEPLEVRRADTGTAPTTPVATRRFRAADRPRCFAPRPARRRARRASRRPPTPMRLAASARRGMIQIRKDKREEAMLKKRR